MTTVVLRETSNFNAQPIEGFHFIGTFANYDYTSSALPIAINSITFDPIAAFGRTGITAATQSDDDGVLEVVMPITTALIQDYAFTEQPPALELELYRSHTGLDTVNEFIIYWKGEVSAFKIDTHTCTLRIPSTMSIALAGEVPNRWYQGTCNNVLGDGRCLVVHSSFHHVTTVSDVNGGALLVASDGGFGAGYFNAGRAILATSEERQITNHIGTSIEVVWPYANINIGDSITLQAGCNLAFSGDCLGKFNNQPKFNGMPFMPSDNPSTGTLG